MRASQESAWSELIDEFRALGGTAENVRLGHGNRGRGLFAVDPARSVQIRAPENLLLPKDDVVFKNGRFAVSPDAKVGERERSWLERYENEFSWGAGGRSETEAFFEGVYALPQPIREKLARSFGMKLLLRELSSELVQERFLDSRVITYQERKVVMPIVEMVNHGPAEGYDCSDGVMVGGEFSGEVLVEYGDEDSLGMFRSWGFACGRPNAMSLSVTIQTEFGPLLVLRDKEDGTLVDVMVGDRMRIRLPRLSVEEGTTKLSFLLLGQYGFPRIPKGVFQRVFRDAGHAVKDETFEMLQHVNRMAFLRLLKDFEGVSGPVIDTIRTVCRMQLETLSWSFGVRDI